MTDHLLKSDFPAYDEATWLFAVSAALKGGHVDDLISREVDGLVRQPLYTQTNTHIAESTRGAPGQSPFIRGSQPERDAHLPWHIAQRYIPGRKGSDNRSMLLDLTGGVSAILLDLSQASLSQKDADKLFGGVMLDIAPLAMTPGVNIEGAQSLFDALWAAQNITADQQHGYLNADPIGAAITAGIDPSLDMVADILAWGKDRPQLRLLSASGIPYHAAGAGEALELALMAASLVSYINAGIEAGESAATLIQKTCLSVAADIDFFATVAKLRAARLIWSQICDAYGVKDAAPYIISEISERSFSTIDPWVNILRATIACCGAAIGGADMVVVAPCTAVSDGDNDLSRRIARNTQIIMQEESHLGHVMDPAGGSWYIESLTQDLAETAWRQFQSIEADGGLLKQLKSGQIAATIKKLAADRFAENSKRAQALIGVSEFPNLEEAPLTARAAHGTGDFREARLSESFEALRQRAEPVKPKVFLAAIGTPARATARVNFAANIFAIGGVASLIGDGGTDYNAIAQAFRDSGAKIACICGADAEYDAHGEALAQALQAAGAVHITLAGKPRNIAEVDAYCFAGCDALAFAQTIHQTLGLGA
jgi:methylmalonyl-CoA mutase